jgi:hypothetical protein
LSDWKRKVTAEYEPTDAQRALVESASAFGITQAEIATQLKISEPTLRKHFREELSSGKFKLDMLAGRTAGLFPPQPTTRHYPIDPIYSTYLYMLEHTFDGARDTSSS